MDSLTPTIKIFALRTAWLETMTLTVLFPATGYVINSSDPFYLDAQFPWLILAPVLISLRYGFLFGMSSISLLIILFLACRFFNWIVAPLLPIEMIVGIILTTVITAEFHDIWRRKLQPLHYKYQYLKLRMAELSRAYYLLKESHVLLEQQAAATKSMRTWLLELQNQVLTLTKHEGESLDDIGDHILNLFGEYGSVQTASVHSVSKSRKISPRPLARLGNPPFLSPTHPLVAAALKTGHVTSLQRENAAMDQEILVVVPLVDVFNTIWGIVVVNEMPMFALQENTLDLFALLGGYLGDLIQRRTEGYLGNDFVCKEFEHELQRTWKDVSCMKASASVILCIFSQAESQNLVVSKFRSQLRGLDKVWSFRDGHGRLIIINLLPLMEKNDLNDFLGRLDMLRAEDLNAFMENENCGRKIILNGDVTVYSWILNEDTPSINPLLAKVAELCPRTPNKSVKKAADAARADIPF